MNFIPVLSFDNYINAHIAFGRLQEEGINCWLKDENTATINPILSNAIGGIKLMVAENDLQKAIQLLEQFNEDRKVKITCPRCGSNNIDLVSTPRKPGNWLSALFGFITFTYSMPVEMVYHCFNCKYEFEPPDGPLANLNN